MDWKKFFSSEFCKKDSKIHTLALTIAVFGPLVNFWIKPYYSSLVFNPYVYWAMALLVYIGILVPFVLKTSDPLFTMSRVSILGIVVEDFASSVWNSLLTGEHLLPFCNWYAQYFPFFDVFGQPTPYILVPQWYILALFVYFSLTYLQYKAYCRIDI